MGRFSGYAGRLAIEKQVAPRYVFSENGIRRAFGDGAKKLKGSKLLCLDFPLSQ
jgi:hypothetical protein